MWQRVCSIQPGQASWRSPEKTNQMGGAWPTLACSHLASLLQMVPLKPSLPTSSTRWLASLQGCVCQPFSLAALQLAYAHWPLLPKALTKQHAGQHGLQLCG